LCHAALLVSVACQKVRLDGVVLQGISYTPTFAIYKNGQKGRGTSLNDLELQQKTELS